MKAASSVTGKQVKESMIANNIDHIDHHECGCCGVMVGYSRVGEQLYFNPGCGCSWSPPNERSWQSAADWINMQNDEWRPKTASKFGITI